MYIQISSQVNNHKRKWSIFRANKWSTSVSNLSQEMEKKIKHICLV